MQIKKNYLAMALGLGLAFGGAAQAANVDVNTDITTSTTWTKDNVYNLTKQIYVRPGATLTIEAGTKVMSTPTVDGSGSLAVTRGAKIYVRGTKDEPVIMTSTNDDLVTWREAANEWGNLTIMGKALIAASHKGKDASRVVVTYPDGLGGQIANTKTPTGLNLRQMEGLNPIDSNDTSTLYGGADDNDDSGSISYLSIRYGGRVVGLANELNGLSMGGIGRATDVDHVEIMNNVDDGIEVWGGTVNFKYISIWNIGDDSFDIDQGWRGKAQFGLIVQGYSLDASQGSGVGDNLFEHDGAEASDAQPVTTGVIYNFTAIGQPGDGDNGTAWRDNCRMQYHNCVWMDTGDTLVKNDNVDGDGAEGYGFNGTMTWAETWAAPYTTTSTVNTAPGAMPGDFNSPEVMYQAQISGNLASITDSVFFRIKPAAADEASAIGDATAYAFLKDAAANNVFKTSGLLTDADAPIQSITRGPLVSKGGKNMFRVLQLDPRAKNEAATSVGTAPDDGFFTPVQFRGGFSPTYNWARGWTAADAYGFYTGPANPAEPVATLALAATTTSFQTEAGVLYTVECSTDGVVWEPFAVVEGTGSTVQVADLTGFEASKLYRAIVQ